MGDKALYNSTFSFQTVFVVGGKVDFYGDLVYKFRGVKGEANFNLSGLKIVKRL